MLWDPFTSEQEHYLCQLLTRMQHPRTQSEAEIVAPFSGFASLRGRNQGLLGLYALVLAA